MLRTMAPPPRDFEDKIAGLCASAIAEDWQEALRLFLEEADPRFLDKVEARLLKRIKFPRQLPRDRRQDDPRYQRAQSLIIERMLVPRTFRKVLQKFDPVKGPLVPYLLNRVDLIIRESLKPADHDSYTDDQPASLSYDVSRADRNPDEQVLAAQWEYFAKLESRQRAILLLRSWRSNAMPRSWRCRVLKDVYAVAQDASRKGWRQTDCRQLRDGWRADADQQESVQGQPAKEDAEDNRAGTKEKRLTSEEFSAQKRTEFLVQMAKAEAHRTARSRVFQTLAAGLEAESTRHRELQELLRSQCRRVLQESRVDRIAELFPVTSDQPFERQRIRYLTNCFAEMKALQAANGAYRDWKKKRKEMFVPYERLASLVGKPATTLSVDASQAAASLRGMEEQHGDAGRILAEIFVSQEHEYSIADLFGSEGQDVDQWIQRRVCEFA